jgi:hypothetical protein
MRQSLYQGGVSEVDMVAYPILHLYQRPSTFALSDYKEAQRVELFEIQQDVDSALRRIGL